MYRIPLHVDDALDSLDDHFNQRRVLPLRGNGNIYIFIMYKYQLNVNKQDKGDHFFSCIFRKVLCFKTFQTGVEL